MDSEILKWFLSREDVGIKIFTDKMAKKAVCLHWDLRDLGS